MIKLNIIMKQEISQIISKRTELSRKQKIKFVI